MNGLNSSGNAQRKMFEHLADAKQRQAAYTAKMHDHQTAAGRLAASPAHAEAMRQSRLSAVKLTLWERLLQRMGIETTTAATAAQVDMMNSQWTESLVVMRQVRDLRTQVAGLRDSLAEALRRADQLAAAMPREQRRKLTWGPEATAADLAADLAEKFGPKINPNPSSDAGSHGISSDTATRRQSQT